MIRKVLFIGSKKLGFSVLETIYSINQDVLEHIITCDDIKDTRSCLDDFKYFSDKVKVPMLVLDKPSNLKKTILKSKPDLVIVVGWYWMIKEELLDLVPFGFIGLHASLLPKYRGFAPLVWAILNNEKETGISMFYFDKEIDSGDIISQKSVSIDLNDSIGDMIKKIEIKSIGLIKKNYPLLIAGKAPRIKQNHDDSTYCSIRKPKDGIINWNLSNTEVHNFIRAQSYPYPGAFSFIGDKKYFILKSGIFNKKYYGVPGTVCEVLNDGVKVSCGKGAIIIRDIRLELDNHNIINSIKFGKQFNL